MAYLSAPAAGVIGMIADARLTKHAESRAAEVAIPVGRFCCRGASDATAKLPTATGMVTGTGIGVSIWQATREPGDYAIGECVPLLEKGLIWVQAEVSTTYGDPVFVRFVTGNGFGSDLGQFRTDADTAKAVQLPEARWYDTGTGVGLRRIELY